MNQTINDLPFEITVLGNGKPASMLIGGLAYSPKDYEQVGGLLRGTNVIVNNPLHKTAKRVSDWQQRLRSAYVQIFHQFACDFLVAHSLGSVESFSFEKNLSNLKGIALIAPPLREGPAIAFNEKRLSYERHAQLRQLHGDENDDDGKMWLLDNSLNKMCPDMDNGFYENLIISHWKEYGPNTKQIYKNEMPKDIGAAVRGLRENIRTARTKVLLLLGTKDPWFEEYPTDLNHVSIRRLPTGHYPHIKMPADTAFYINSFKDKFS